LDEIVIDGTLQSGIFYSLFELPGSPTMIADALEAEEYPSEFSVHHWLGRAQESPSYNDPIYSKIIAVGGLDIDFSLNWRPSSMLDVQTEWGIAPQRYCTISLADYVIVTFEDRTTMIPLAYKKETEEDVLPHLFDGKPSLPKESKRLPLGLPVPLAPIEFPHLGKVQPTTHVPIFPGLRGSHLLWINGEDDHMIVSTRDGEDASRDVIEADRGAGDQPVEIAESRTDWYLRPRKMGVRKGMGDRLSLSLMNGSVYSIPKEGNQNALGIWEFL
jgi:hypothetical protein